MKKKWISWALPGLAVLLLDRIVKAAYLWAASFRIDGTENLSEAPLMDRLAVQFSEALNKAFAVFRGPAEQSQVIRNSGMAFGMFQGNSAVIFAVSVLLVIACVFLIRKMRPAGLAPVALSMIAGGAAGNMIDRVAYGSVVDMFPFFGWFVFNVADVGVVAGAILCGISLLFRPQDWSRL